MYMYYIPGNFHVAKSLRKWQFSIISQKNIFTNDPCGQHKRCGMAILSQNLISRLSKICENKATQNFPVYGIWCPNNMLTVRLTDILWARNQAVKSSIQRILNP